jgi:hypothetical protein
VDGDAGGLIEHEQVLILVHDGGLDTRDELPWGLSRLPGWGQPYGGDTDPILGLQTPLGTRPVAVHADLSLADHPVHTASRDATEVPLEVVVEALSGLLLGDLEMPDAGAHFARVGTV